MLFLTGRWGFAVEFIFAGAIAWLIGRAAQYILAGK
jgi:hypothetical protein